MTQHDSPEISRDISLNLNISNDEFIRLDLDSNGDQFLIVGSFDNIVRVSIDVDQLATFIERFSFAVNEV